MAKWLPLTARTHFSLLRALSKPAGLAEACRGHGYAACGITDLCSAAGVPPFMKAAKDKGLRGIAGCDFDGLHILADGTEGWRRLVKAVSKRSKDGKLSMADLAGIGEGKFVLLTGRLGSPLGDSLFSEPAAAWLARDYAEAKALVRPDWRKSLRDALGEAKATFGEKAFAEVHMMDAKSCPAAEILTKALRCEAPKAGVKVVAGADPRYPSREDAPDLRILLCTLLNCTVDQAEGLAARREPMASAIFRSSCFHLPSPEEMAALHEPAELELAETIAGMCETPSPPGKPLLPSFPLPPGETPEGKVREMCREGWRRLKLGDRKDAAKYAARAKEELEVLEKAGLCSYFLITRDAIRFAVEELGCIRAEGRGSAAGCLASWLMGVTGIDPVRFGLSFERFYSQSRFVPAHVAFPEVAFK